MSTRRWNPRERATHTVETALRAAGVNHVRGVLSLTVAAGSGYPHGTTRTDVLLYPHNNRDRIIGAVRALPRIVDLRASRLTVRVYLSPETTSLGPGGRDGLTMREAVRQSRLIHPDWTAAQHVDWLLDDGFPVLNGRGRKAAEAMLAVWLAVEQHDRPI